MPVNVKGFSSAASFDTGRFGRTRPRRRKSTITIVPIKTASRVIWIDSMRGNSHSDPLMALATQALPSQWKN
jgi:hypothetical protein